jgi:transcriptional regulator
MYIPNLNLMTDKTEIVDFMQRFSFTTIITAKDNYPVGTHLPFVVTFKDNNIILTSHFAKANEQWKDMLNNTVLVIFSEPHAYISPKNYDKELNVPTWNYIAVHTYGQATVITDQNQVLNILENTIEYYDQSYKKQWDNLPESYKLGMIKGIIAFEIAVTDLQGKKKLSQNKTINEQQRIISTLSGSTDNNERIIADYMEKDVVR